MDLELLAGPGRVYRSSDRELYDNAYRAVSRIRDLVSARKFRAETGDEGAALTCTMLLTDVLSELTPEVRDTALILAAGGLA